MSSYTVLLDPAANPRRDYSFNLGDSIIGRHCQVIIRSLFPQHDLVKIPLHVPLSSADLRRIRQADFAFVGGSNVLKSRRGKDPRLTVKPRWRALFPPRLELILLGMGWATADAFVSPAQRLYYRSILSHTLRHSLRDASALANLQRIGFESALHTGCPTLWELKESSLNLKFDAARPDAVLTLAGHHPQRERDEALVRAVLEHTPGKIFFFAQHEEDAHCLRSLDAFKRNSAHFELLPPSIDAYLELLKSAGRLNYIGTRLHGGIEALNHGLPTLIVAIDHRAREMRRGSGLPVIERSDAEGLARWFRGDLDMPPIRVAREAIHGWRSQFAGR